MKTEESSALQKQYEKSISDCDAAWRLYAAAISLAGGEEEKQKLRASFTNAYHHKLVLHAKIRKEARSPRQGDAA